MISVSVASGLAQNLTFPLKLQCNCAAKANPNRSIKTCSIEVVLGSSVTCSSLWEGSPEGCFVHSVDLQVTLPTVRRGVRSQVPWERVGRGKGRGFGVPPAAGGEGSARKGRLADKGERAGGWGGVGPRGERGLAGTPGADSVPAVASTALPSAVPAAVPVLHLDARHGAGAQEATPARGRGAEGAA